MSRSIVVVTDLPPAAAWQRWWQERSVDDSLVQVASEQGFVLACADLPALGYTRSQMRTAVRRGRWTVAARGFVTPLDLRDADPYLERRRRISVAAAAAVLGASGQVVSGPTAAVLRGLPVRVTPLQPGTTVGSGANLGPGPARHVYGAALDPAECVEWFGIPVTNVARTAVDVARHDRRGGLMVADAALRERLTDVGSLDAALRRSAGWPGVRQARDVLRVADGRAESPLESITRLALHDDGFPPPALQLRIGPYRVDHAWPERMLVLESDGRVKYTAEERWAEKTREQFLRREGWRVERVVWRDITGDWERTRAILRSYF